MTLCFKAIEVKAEPEDEEALSYLWFGALERRHYLSLSRFNSPDETGPIEIERDDQKWRHEGGIVSCRLSMTLMEINLSEEAALALGGVNAFEIGLVLDAAMFARVKQTLTNLFRDYDGLHMT